MDKNIQQATKQALLYGFIGAAVTPLIYECYANVMREIAIALAIIGAVFVGIKLSRYDGKTAFAAITTFYFISAGFGTVLTMFAHDYVVRFLESHSKYFYLSFQEIVQFIIKMAMCYFIVIAIYFCRAIVNILIRKVRANGEASASYIENAFNDDEQDKKL